MARLAVMTPTAEPAQGNHRATYREVLAEPRFRLLFSTRAVAITADALRITTFSVLVFAATGSALLSALAFGIGFIPQLFGSLLLGSLADRLPPRALITGGYALTCAAALLLALVQMPVAASLGVVALVSLATPVFHGASSRLVAQSLEGDAYVLGRSLNNIAAAGAQLFGLALGGAAVAALGPRRALAASAVLYLGEISAHSASGELMVRGIMDDLDDELPVLSFNGPGDYRLRIHARGRRGRKPILRAGGRPAEGQVGERSADHAENEASKVCVNPESPGTRTIAPRARPSQPVGIYQPRDELMPL
jgi:MFS family permease